MLQKSVNQFASRRKRFPPLEPDSCLGYTSIPSLFNKKRKGLKSIDNFKDKQMTIDKPDRCGIEIGR